MLKEIFVAAAIGLGGVVALFGSNAAQALELNATPSTHVYANAANPGASQFDVVLQVIGIFNDGTDAVTLEAVEIDLIADGISFLTKRIDPSRLSGRAARDERGSLR